MSSCGGEWWSEGRGALLDKVERGEIVMIDVRPANEFTQAHLPCARSMPLPELPKDKPVVAYCRGPFCLMSSDAVRLLREHGYDAHKLRDGVAEWSAAMTVGSSEKD